MKQDYATIYRIGILHVGKLVVTANLVGSAVVFVLACIDLSFLDKRWGYDWQTVIAAVFMFALSIVVRGLIARALSRKNL